MIQDGVDPNISSVETLHHPPKQDVCLYGEEKVQTPNKGSAGRVKLPALAAQAVVGMNQQVGGSNPSAGSNGYAG